MKYALLVPLALLAGSATAPAASRFLTFPLKCADKACTFKYKDPYTTGSINSVLDHSMMKKKGAAFHEYGKYSDRSGDGIVVAFNGERSSGARLKGDDTCVKPRILLRPSPKDRVSAAMTRVNDCGSDYAQYDEHPGYDYYAKQGVEVRASASGRVVNISGNRCYSAFMGRTCAYWGAIGLDHGNGYITQYVHMTNIPKKLTAGSSVDAGDLVGLVGKEGAAGYHLHFEVLKKVGSEYLIVDPYGWVGSGSDPLYSAGKVTPAKLWK
jgi:murein DD-endopeptidase MepM/ murein hydrolase activator NlpD